MPKVAQAANVITDTVMQPHQSWQIAPKVMETAYDSLFKPKVFTACKLIGMFTAISYVKKAGMPETFKVHNVNGYGFWPVSTNTING